MAQVNFGAICRACMASAGALQSVGSPLDADENTPIMDVVEELTAIRLSTGDGLPEGICERCVQELRRFVEFIRQVRLTDRALRQMFKEGVASSERKKVPMLEIQKVEMEEDNGVEEYLEYEEVIWKEGEKDHHEELIFELKVESGSDVEFQGFEEDVKDVKDVEMVSKMRPVTGRGKPRNGQKRKRSKDLNGSTNAEWNEEMNETEREIFHVLERQEGQHLCCGCFQMFDCEEELAEHSAGHASKSTINLQKRFVCPTCSRRYTSAASLEAHRKQTESVKIYECVRCRIRMVDPKRRYLHAQNHPARDVIQSEYLEPIRVLPRHGTERRICCATGCSRAFKNETEMIAHAHDEHSTNKIEYDLPAHRDKPHECLVCFKKFYTYQSMLTHQKRRYRRLGRQCSLCGQSLHSAAALAAHERMHRNIRPFQCQVCEKSFASAPHLKAHMITHSSDKPYVCSVCGTGFQRKGALQKHELIHMDAMPFQCQQCSKAFRVKARLDLHMRTHTGEKPYSCRYCEKTFADHTNRHRHEMSHTGIKPYKCNYCAKTFITRRLQQEHESSVHSAVITFTCNVCMATFNNRKQYREHCREHVESDTTLLSH